MLVHEYDTLRAVEDHHWWYAVQRHLLQNALLGRLPEHGRVLDAGCGTGGTMVFLKKCMPGLDLHGVDASDHALRHCHQRGLSQVSKASVHELPFADASFDTVLSLDVLYHAEVEENSAMSEMTRVLRPGGLWVANLPAFECLRGSHDDAVCGVKRYTSCHVRTLVWRHSLEVEMIHYWNAWLYLPLFLWRWRSRFCRRAGNAVRSDMRLLPPTLDRMMSRVGMWDAWLCRELHLPFGSSLFTVARKRQTPGGDRR